jgi:hypothetical protein
MARAVVSVAPNFIGAVANSLYTKEMTAIALRELLQNSLDACLRAGRDPSIQIKVKKVTDSEFTVYCRDNGCGMEDWEIEENFLGAGASSKGDTNKAVGRFGVASTLIFMASKFTLKTHGWYLDQQMLRDRAEILPADEYIDGCEIEVTMPVRYWYQYAIDQSKEFFFTSSFPMVSNISVEFDNCGSSTGKFTYPCYVSPISVPVYSGNLGLICSTPQVLFMSDEGKRYELGAVNVVRINGLSQIVESASAGRTTNLFFDVDAGSSQEPTFDSPQEKNDYPFSLNREQIKGEWKEQFRHATRMADLECVTAQMNLDLSQTPKIQLDKYFNSDNKVHGLRNSMADPQTTVATDININQFEELVGEITVMSNAIDPYSVKYEDKKVTFNNVAFYFDPYYQKAPSERSKLWRTKSFSKVWFALVKMCADESDFFGIGFTGNPYTNADRVYVSEGKGIFYLINVAMLESELSAGMSIEGLLIAMWGIACHLTAHFHCYEHNERFAVYEGAIQRSTASMFFKSQKTLSKILSSRI